MNRRLPNTEPQNVEDPKTRLAGTLALPDCVQEARPTKVRGRTDVRRALRRRSAEEDGNVDFLPYVEHAVSDRMAGNRNQKGDTMEEKTATQQETVASAIAGLSVLEGGLETGSGKTEVLPDSSPEPANRLTARQLRLVMALVSNPDIQAACMATGVGRTAAHRWLKQPIFQDELTRQREAVLGEALAKVKTHAARAVTELGELLNEKDSRLRRLVCKDILDRAIKIRDMEDIERRLTALEKAMKKRK